jgi:ketosteroid isomerase-like protein
MRYEVPIIIAEGDKVAVNIRVFFRKSSNDRIVQFDIAAFYTLRDGRIAQIREIMDTFDLVQQLLERDVGAVLAEPGKI